MHDEMLCREIIGVDVFSGTKKGTVKRSAKWAEVVDNLENVKELHFKVDNRAVRDRYNLLSSNLRRKLKREQKESGIVVDMSEVEKALESLIEKEDAAEELRQEGKLKKVANEAERMNAEDIRKKAMESLGETQKRKNAESGMKPRKKRSNGSDTVNYLKEKHEKMLEVEKKKLEMEEKKIEAANNRHEELLTTLQQQQQQQIETFQVMMLQQQQQMQMQQAQQNEMMLKLFGMLNNK